MQLSDNLQSTPSSARQAYSLLIGDLSNTERVLVGLDLRLRQ